MTRWNDSSAKPDFGAGESNTDYYRHVVQTDQGWVHEYRYTDAQGNTKVRRECLVAINGLSDANHGGSPTMLELVAANSAGGSTLRVGVTNKIYALFDEQLTGSPLNWTIQAANTANQDSMNRIIATGVATLGYANNALEFDWTANTGGTYKVQTQTISNTTNGVVSLSGAAAIAKTISDAVSNTLAEFTVYGSDANKNRSSIQFLKGGSNTFTMELNGPGTGTVAVTLDDTFGIVTISPTTLNFTTANWMDQQTVTVSCNSNMVSVDTSANISYTATGGGMTFSGTVAVTVKNAAS